MSNVGHRARSVCESVVSVCVCVCVCVQEEWIGGRSGLVLNLVENSGVKCRSSRDKLMLAFSHKTTYNIKSLLH